MHNAVLLTLCQRCLSLGFMTAMAAKKFLLTSHVTLSILSKHRIRLKTSNTRNAWLMHICSLTSTWQQKKGLMNYRKLRSKEVLISSLYSFTSIVQNPKRKKSFFLCKDFIIISKLFRTHLRFSFSVQPHVASRLLASAARLCRAFTMTRQSSFMSPMQEIRGLCFARTAKLFPFRLTTNRHWNPNHLALLPPEVILSTEEWTAIWICAGRLATKITSKTKHCHQRNKSFPLIQTRVLSTSMVLLLLFKHLPFCHALSVFFWFVYLFRTFQNQKLC